MLSKIVNSARNGLQRATSMVNEGAQQVAQMNSKPAAKANGAEEDAPAVVSHLNTSIDPVEAVISIKSGQIMYQANLEVLKSTDELRGKAADLIA